MPTRCAGDDRCILDGPMIAPGACKLSYRNHPVPATKATKSMQSPCPDTNLPASGKKALKTYRNP
jgi:hypothetical protein